MPDQSTDLSTANQPAGTTRIENGVAYDVSGKPLGQANVPGETAQPQAAQGFDFGFGKQAPAQTFDFGFGKNSPQPAQAESPLRGAAQATSIGPRPKDATNWYADLKGDLDNGTDATWVGWLLKKAGAKGLAQGNSPEIGHMMGGPLYGLAETGHAAASYGENHATATQAANEAASGVGHVLAPLAATQPEALPFIATAAPVQQASYAVAKKMGADDDTAELVSNVAGLVGGGKAIEHANIDRFGIATNEHISAQRVYDTRVREVGIATTQAQEAQAMAEQMRSEHGAGSNEFNEAQTRASEAAANAKKAQQALTEAAEKKAETGVKLNKIARNIQKDVNTRPDDVVNRETQVKSDFRKIINDPKSNITDKDLDVGMRYLENHHANVENIETKKDLFDALDHTQQSMETQVKPYIEKYADETNPANVMMDVRDKLAGSSQEDFIDRGMKALDNFNLDNPTIAESDHIRTDLNALNRETLARGRFSVATALRADPEFAARYHAAESLRNGEYDLLEKKNVQGVRELRQDESSIIKLRNAVEKGVGKGDVKVRGSGETSWLRDKAAKAAPALGGATGAMVGGAALSPFGPGGTIVGGIAGRELGHDFGTNLGKRILQGDLTHDQMVQRIMKNNKGLGVPTTQIIGAGEPAAGPRELSLSQKDMQQIQREYGPLHSELASHYGVSVDSDSYGNLEQQFMNDIADKQQHGMALEPPEKQLLNKINQQNAADILKAREDKLQAQFDKPIGKYNLPERVEPLLRPDKPLKNGLTMEEGLTHDLAHVVVGNELGLKFEDGIRSHLHPENQGTGNVMTAPIDWSGFVDKEGNLDFNKLSNKISDIATTYVAGGVANDLYHGVPFTENKGLGADINILRDYLREVGFSPRETSMMIAQAADNAATILSRPGMREILEGHADLREAGLNEKYHFSPDRIEQVLQDVKEGTKREATTGHNAKSSRTSDEAGSNLGAGAEGKAKANDLENVHGERKGSVASKEEGARKPDESASATEGSSVAKPGNPALSERPELTHLPTEKGGQVRLDTEQEGLLKNRGLLKYTMEGDEARVTASNLDKDFRGQGLGTEMYERAAQEAKAKGAKVLTSDLGGQTSMDAAAVWERLKKAHPGQVEGPFANKVGSPGYRWTFNPAISDIHEIKPQNPALSEIRVPPERSTNNPEIDRAIKQGGGIPGGLQKGDPEIGLKDLALFHDPTSGSTLAYYADSITPERVREQLQNSRAQYAKGARKELPEGSKFVQATPEEHRAELDKNPQAATLSDKTVDQLRDHKIFKVQTPEGKDTGIQYHITPEGEAGGFVNNGPYKNATPAILKHAAENGATHANSWDVGGALPKLYEKNGLVKTTSTPYDESTYGAPSEQLKSAWKAAGWKEGEPYPSVQNYEFPKGTKPQNPALSTAPFSGVHYSPVERQTLLGVDRGRALAGEEAARLQHDNKVPGVYVYREGTTPEPQISTRQFKYNVGGDKAIADISENGTQRPIFDKAYQSALDKYKQAGDNDTIAHQKAMNDGEAAIRNAGYDGYESDRMKGSTFLFGDQPIKSGTKPQNPALSEDRISTRVPQGKNATENHLEGEPLTIGRQTVDQSPQKLQDKFADKARAIEGVKVPKNITDNAKVFDRFTRHVADNLKWLYNQVPKEQQVANAKWYDSAHNMTKQLAEQHGLAHTQAAGVMAAMSPQMDWDMNVSLGKRIMDIYKNHADAPVTPEMIQKGRDIIEQSRQGKNKVANQSLEGMLGNLEGKKIGELTGLERAAAVRLYDETYNPKQFPRIDPATGNEMEMRTNADGTPANLGWGNLNNAAKALSILDNGTRENISNQVGESHKVRNFYNNIIDPTNPEDVTIDTHAVGASLLHPVGGNAKVVTDNFGAGGKSLGTGVKGTYPLYAEGYRLAAKELGLKARELQSVTWEKVRDLFPAEWKTKENLATVQKEWKKYSDGKQDVDTTRQNILKMATDAKAEIDAQRIAAQAKQKSGTLAGHTISALDFMKALRDNKAGVSAGAGALQNEGGK